jgi:hypothetical protein
LQTLAPFIKWVADPADDEWAKFYKNLVNSVPLFCLKNNKRVATTHLVMHCGEIPDCATDLEEATGCELVTNSEEARDEQQWGNGLHRPNHDAENEQIERRVSAQLEDSISTSHRVRSTLSTGSGAKSNRG